MKRNSYRFDQNLKDNIFGAVKAIKNYDYDLAVAYLKKASQIDLENPIIFNLLGILYEKQGDYIKASKFYRVAYYMDQTFLAPCDNLERVSTLLPYRSTKINWGLERLI